MKITTTIYDNNVGEFDVTDTANKFSYNIFSNLNKKVDSAYTMRPIKYAIREWIADCMVESAYSNKKREAVLTTLCDNNLNHEDLIHRRLPNVTTISVNNSDKNIKELKGKNFKKIGTNTFACKTNPKMILHKGNILNKKVIDLNFTITQQRAISKIYWFDFCGTHNVYNETFDCIKNMPKRGHKTIFLTFSIMPRTEKNTEGYEKLFGYNSSEDDLNTGVVKMIKDIDNKMRPMGYEFIDFFTYVAGGGKMVTIGYREPFSEIQINEIKKNRVLDFTKQIAKLGYTPKEISNIFGEYNNVPAIGGLSKAITMRNV